MARVRRHGGAARAVPRMGFRPGIQFRKPPPETPPLHARARHAGFFQSTRVLFRLRCAPGTHNKPLAEFCASCRASVPMAAPPVPADIDCSIHALFFFHHSVKTGKSTDKNVSLLRASVVPDVAGNTRKGPATRWDICRVASADFSERPPPPLRPPPPRPLPATARSFRAEFPKLNQASTIVCGGERCLTNPSSG
jgi:hypothetical protein